LFSPFFSPIGLPHERSHDVPGLVAAAPRVRFELIDTDHNDPNSWGEPAALTAAVRPERLSVAGWTGNERTAAGSEFWAAPAAPR
jgi:hypothetical protein